MDQFVDGMLQPLADASLRRLIEAALQNFYAFTLVLVRMSGLMTIGPLFGQSLVPVNVRVMLVLTLSLLITPTLHNQTRLGFARLDLNGDGRLSRDEMPETLRERFEEHQRHAGREIDDSLSFAEFQPPLRIPTGLLDFARIGLGEFALGLVLGLGVLTILSGLQLAGDLADQQSGMSLGEMSNPGLEISGSVTGQLLFQLGITAMLVMEPLGGHLLMVSGLVETFQTLPVGEAFVATPAIELLRDLVHQSLVLALQVAAPVLAVMSLVALAMGFLGHTVPQINVLVIGFPVRVMVNLAVIIASLTGVSQVVVDAVPATIDALRQTLTGLP